MNRIASRYAIDCPPLGAVEAREVAPNMALTVVYQRRKIWWFTEARGGRRRMTEFYVRVCSGGRRKGWRRSSDRHVAVRVGCVVYRDGLWCYSACLTEMTTHCSLANFQ